MRKLQGCRNQGCQGCGTPNFWQIIYLSIQRGRFCPQFTTGSPNFFSPSGIPQLVYVSSIHMYLWTSLSVSVLTRLQVHSLVIFVCGPSAATPEIIPHMVFCNLNWYCQIGSRQISLKNDKLTNFEGILWPLFFHHMGFRNDWFCSIFCVRIKVGH